MRGSLRLFKSSSASSKAWLARQGRDPYVKQRSQQSPSSSSPTYRSRSAFKLVQLDEKFKLFRGGRNELKVIVDLGAAPGGWSQVIAHRMGFRDGDGENTTGDSSEAKARAIRKPTTRIIALDILSMVPINGVSFIRQNFLNPEADESIAKLLPRTHPEVDLVLSDIAVNLSGNPTRDAAMSLEVCESVLRFSERFLKKEDDRMDVRGGSLVMKYFASEEMDVFYKTTLKHAFDFVARAKPDASRSESSEFYFVCKGFKPRIGADGQTLHVFYNG